MVSSTIIPVQYGGTTTNTSSNLFSSPKSSKNSYSVQEHGQGHRTFSYEFDLYDYEPEEITVLVDDYGTLRIRAYRPPCREFKCEYNLGGPNMETTLVRNTLNTQGRLRVEVDVRPKANISQSLTTPIITENLQGYLPGNVTVKLNHHGLLKISAQHFDDTAGNSINRQFYRQYQLPSNIRPDQIRARLDDNQILTIDVPNSSTNQREYWVPVRERNYSPFYGSGPNGAYCCCNLM